MSPDEITRLIAARPASESLREAAQHSAWEAVSAAQASGEPGEVLAGLLESFAAVSASLEALTSDLVAS